MMESPGVRMFHRLAYHAYTGCLGQDEILILLNLHCAFSVACQAGSQTDQ